MSSELVQAHTTPRASLLDASYRFHIADNAMWATVSTVDLVLASWVWSEMINNPAASAYWNRMCQEMRAGGVLIVLDRNEERVDAFLRTFINFSPRLRLLASYQDTDHAGFFYEDEVRDKYRPRLNFGAHAYLLAVA